MINIGNGVQSNLCSYDSEFDGFYGARINKRLQQQLLQSKLRIDLGDAEHHSVLLNALQLHRQCLITNGRRKKSEVDLGLFRVDTHRPGIRGTEHLPHGRRFTMLPETIPTSNGTAVPRTLSSYVVFYSFLFLSHSTRGGVD